jgi:maleylpyruvate isomerase
MTLRSRDDALRWAIDGTKKFIDAIDGLGVGDYDTPSLLPGWRRRHVVAHVASNADALGNLVHWAKTGHPTPMYASPEQRIAGIERGSSMSPEALDAWVRDSAAALTTAWDTLDDAHWEADVVTAQGRTVPAGDIPWLRVREVWVHLVDLDRGVGFGDLPEDFLVALRADVRLKRGDVPKPGAPLWEEVAWLTGRPHNVPDVPALAAWL